MTTPDPEQIAAGKALCQFVYDRSEHIAAALRHPDAVPGDLVDRLREIVSSAYYTGAEDVHRAWIANLGQLDADFGEAASDYVASVELPDFAAAIQTLTARLEVVPGWSQDTDGIACRDATIEGLDKRVSSLTAERDAALARMAELGAQGKRALWQLMRFPIMRYLMANTHGRLDGAEKAHRHTELVTIYCAVRLGLGEGFGLNDEVDPHQTIMAIHDATQAMTSYMDEKIGFPVFDKHPDYDALAPLFFECFLELADARALLEGTKP